MTFQGGPPDGLRIRVLPNEASSYRVGFCIVTATGPVQALYEPGPAGVCRFASLEFHRFQFTMSSTFPAMPSGPALDRSNFFSLCSPGD